MMLYNGDRASRWCKKHAQDPQPFVHACAWFCSNGLWYGGLPQTDEWNDQGELQTDQGRVMGSPAARIADKTVRYLVDAGHLAMVVGVVHGIPIVAEWGTAPEGAGDFSRYRMRGWSWSENSRKWLTEIYPNVTARLIHIL